MTPGPQVRSALVLIALALSSIATACDNSSDKPATPQATATTSSPAASATPIAATPTSTAPATPTVASPAADRPAAGGDPAYVDDRTSVGALLRSYANAVNRHEYLRAYSYWEPQAAASQVPPFATFEQGFADTASVELRLGTVTSDVGAGQLNFSAPTTLVVTNKDGSRHTFVGCYKLHLSQPPIQGTPPFQPLGIRSATVREIGAGENADALMATACS